MEKIATVTVLFKGKSIAIYKDVFMHKDGSNTVIYDGNNSSKLIASISPDYTVLAGKINEN